MRRLAITAALIGLLGISSLAVQARTPRHGDRPVRSGAFVKVPHLTPQPTSATPYTTRAQALAAVARYWPGVARHAPKSIQFGLVNLHFFGATGPVKAWIVTY